MTAESHLIEDTEGRRRWLVTEFVTCIADRHDTLTAAKSGCTCPTAREIVSRYNKRREAGYVLPLIDATGTRRRLQALAYDGWALERLAAMAEAGPETFGRVQRNARGPKVRPETAAKVRALFDRLAASQGGSARTASHARRQGWLPWHVWEAVDIDDPDALPDVQETSHTVFHTDVDEVAVARFVNGDNGIRLNRAERWAAYLSMRGRHVTHNQASMRLGLSGSAAKAWSARYDGDEAVSA